MLLVFNKHLSQPWGGRQVSVKWVPVRLHINNLIAVPGENLTFSITFTITVLVFMTALCGDSQLGANQHLVHTGPPEDQLTSPGDQAGTMRHHH